MSVVRRIAKIFKKSNLSLQPEKESLDKNFKNLIVNSHKEKYDKINIHYFLKFVNDFFNAPVESFIMPKVSHNGRVYGEIDSERKAKHIPGFIDCFKKLLGQASKEKAIFLISVRWPDRYNDFRTKGFADSFANQTIAILPEGHKYQGEWKISDMVHEAIHVLRGPFDYGDYGVFVVEIPVGEIDNYFEFYNENKNIRSKLEIFFPPEYIIDLVGNPSVGEKSAIEKVLRAYWRNMKNIGFMAYSESRDLLISNGQNTREDKIPRILKKGETEIGLGTNWEAQGLLEAAHRIFVINSVIDYHRTAGPKIIENKIKITDTNVVMKTALLN